MVTWINTVRYIPALGCYVTVRVSEGLLHQRTRLGDFPGGPVVATSPSNPGYLGLIPSRGARIPQASWTESQDMKEKQCYNKFNADFKNGTHQKKKKKSFFKTTTKDRHISQMQYRAREITNKRQHNSIIQFVWSSKQVKLAYEIRSEDSGYPEGVGNGRILQGTF